MKVIRILRRLYSLFYAGFFGPNKNARRLGVKVGKNSRIYTLDFGSEPFLVSIGDSTTVSSQVRFITHDGSTGLVRNERGSRYQRYLPIMVGDNVFIGANCIILPGVVINSWSIVGAGSVVTKDVPAGSVVAGNPARVITDYKSYSEKIKDTCPNDDELCTIRDYRNRVEFAVETHLRLSEK